MSPRSDPRLRTIRAYREAAQFVASIVLECGCWHGISVQRGKTSALEQLMHGILKHEPDRRERTVVAIYTARVAHLRLDSADGIAADARADDDNVQAALLLAGLPGRDENALRDRAAALVADHWSDIDLIARELDARGYLDEAEAEFMVEAAHGNVDARSALIMIRDPRTWDDDEMDM